MPGQKKWKLIEGTIYIYIYIRVHQMPNFFKNFKGLYYSRFRFIPFVLIGFHAKNSGNLLSFSLAILSFYVYYIMPYITFCHILEDIRKTKWKFVIGSFYDFLVR